MAAGGHAQDRTLDGRSIPVWQQSLTHKRCLVIGECTQQERVQSMDVNVNDGDYIGNEEEEQC